MFGVNSWVSVILYVSKPSLELSLAQGGIHRALDCPKGLSTLPGPGLASWVPETLLKLWPILRSGRALVTALDSRNLRTGSHRPDPDSETLDLTLICFPGKGSRAVGDCGTIKRIPECSGKPVHRAVGSCWEDPVRLRFLEESEVVPEPPEQVLMKLHPTCSAPPVRTVVSGASCPHPVSPHPCPLPYYNPMGHH